MTIKSTMPELRASIYYLSETEGGRSMPVLSGYRGQFYYDGHNWVISQEFINTDICEVGHSVIADIVTMSPRFHRGRFFVGKTFEIREGPKVVAIGNIIDVLDKSFVFWDYETFFNSLPDHIIPYTKNNIQDVINLIKDIIDPAQDKNITNINVLQNLTCKDKMLRIDCQIVKDHNSVYTPTDNIIKDWEAVFSYRYHLYKLDIIKENNLTYQMHFAFFDTHYLTGVINFNEIEV